MLEKPQLEFLRSLLTRARLRTGIPKKHKRTQTFYDEQRSGPGPDERDPATLSGLLDKLVINKGWDLQIAGGRLRARWPELAGRDVSEHVAIETFNLDPSGQSGTLVLRADSTTWATQMRLLLPVIQERLDDEIGVGRITEIKILGPNAPSWKHGIRSVPGRGPRDTYG
jgi:predicted nucleic acid-binding Zn ribbon protein